MNRTILAAAAVLSLAACTKEQPAFKPAASTGKADLTVSIQSGTKATSADTENEAKVNSLQVFVFNGDNLDAYGSGTGTSLTITASQGSRDIYAVVNGPSTLGSITSKTALLAASTSLVTDNNASSFVMVGKATQTLGASGTVSITVSRIAARVKIDKITRAFKSDGMKSLSSDKVKIVRLYLSNVVDNNNYAVSASPSVWYSSMLAGGAAIKTDCPLIYNRPATAPTLAEGASFTNSQSFYCYPNATASDGSSSRVTRLVVELSIDGNNYTYPIALGAIQANRSYEISELRITRFGNPSDGDDTIEGSEDDLIQTSSASFNVVISDWEQVLVSSGDAGSGVVVL